MRRRTRLPPRLSAVSWALRWERERDEHDDAINGQPSRGRPPRGPADKPGSSLMALTTRAYERLAWPANGE